MVRRIVLASLLSVGVGFGVGDARVCANGNCAEPFEFCWETALEIDGQWKDCCSGFCLGPHGSLSCNGDSNQCRCYDIGLK